MAQINALKEIRVKIYKKVTVTTLTMKNNIVEKKNKIKISLRKHLINFGFKFFNNFDQYNLWKENYFKKGNIPSDTKKKYLSFLEKKFKK